MKNKLVIIAVLLLIAGIAFGVTKNNSEKKKIKIEKAKVFKETVEYVKSARIKATKGDYNSAQEDCDKALKIDSKNSLAIRCKAEVFKIQNRKNKYRK